jgi:hypothetical protein
MTNVARWAILVLGLAAITGCPRPNATPPANGDRSMAIQETEREVHDAVALAEPVLAAAGAKPSDYRLLRAINLVSPKGDYRGPAYWALTFKRRDLVPADESSELGAGGEIRVDVDTAKRVASITSRD